MASGLSHCYSVTIHKRNDTRHMVHTVHQLDDADRNIPSGLCQCKIVPGVCDEFGGIGGLIIQACGVVGHTACFRATESLIR